jgi:hypothetical protein
MFRQPVRTLFLALLVGLAAFALVSRWTEYIVITQETARLEADYRPIGILEYRGSPRSGVREGMELVSQSRYVRLNNELRYAQGVMPHTQNLRNRLFFPNFEMDLMGVYAGDSVFAATVEEMGLIWLQTWYFDERNLRIFERLPFFSLLLRVDELYAGFPSLSPVRGKVQLLVPFDERLFSERRSTLHNIIGSRYDVAMYAELADLETELEIGGQYVFRGLFDWDLVGILHADGASSNMLMLPLTEGAWFVEGDDISRYPELTDEIELLNVNQRSLQVVAVMDMTSIPMTQNEGSDITLERGRWLNYDDHLNARPVAVMHRTMAHMLGLWVGDTVSVDIRDLTPQNRHYLIPASDAGWRDYPVETIEFEIVGIYLYGASFFAHNDYRDTRKFFIPESVMPQGFGAVQAGGWHDTYMASDSYSFVLDSPRHQQPFIDEYAAELNAMGISVVFRDESPGVFAASVDSIMFTLTVNIWVFTLTSAVAASLAVFIYLRQTKRNFAILRALGCPSHTAVRQSFVPALILWLPAGIAGAYGAWRFALIRAGQTLATLVANATLIRDRRGLTVIYHAAELPMAWFVVMCAVIFVILFLALLAGSVRIARIPVLELLQGERAAKDSRKGDADSVIPNRPTEKFKFTEFTAEPKPKQGYKADLRRVIRQILRSPVKSAIAAGTAAAFVVALSWMQHTITTTQAELEYLYQNTQIVVHVRRDSDVDNSDPPQPLSRVAPLGNVIGFRAINSLVEHEFVIGTYLTALSNGPYLFAAEADGTFPYETLQLMTDASTDRSEHDGVRWARWIRRIHAMNDIEIFLEKNNDEETINHLQALRERDFGQIMEEMSDEDLMFAQMMLAEQGLTMDEAMEAFGFIVNPIVITYAEGFDAGHFAFDMENEFTHPIPVIMEQKQMELMGLDLGDIAYMCDMYHRLRRNHYTQVQIIGSYTGTITTEIPGEHPDWLEGAMLMPINGKRIAMPGFMYNEGFFYIDPERNMDFAVFRDFVDEVFRWGTGSRSLVRSFILDGDLRIAADPLERSLQLLRILYPITIALSFIMGTGLAGLLTIQGAKVAALMRVLGATKRGTRAALCFELFAVSAAGILIGLVILPVFGVKFAAVLLLLALLYLTSVLIGAVFGAVLVSRRPPMELLQVKE